MSSEDFYTLKGYELRNGPAVTPAMEDYLEMICREARDTGFARVNLLAHRLNVRPSSVSKMVTQLRELGLVSSEKYGLVRPTAKGAELGSYLLRRHELLFRFFQWVNGTEDVLEQVEQVEHFIQPETLENLAKLMERSGP